MVTLMQNYKVKKYSFFGLLSLFIMYLFYITPIIFDDKFNKAHASLYNSFAKDWNATFSMYFSWSSRTLVNFVMYQMEVHGKYLFAIVTGLFFFVMLMSVSAFINDRQLFKFDVSIGVALMTVPLVYYSTAGWIATTTTYLYPICAATYALTALKMKKKAIWQEILLCLATLYAANNEQVLIVLLFIFSAFSLSQVCANHRLNTLIVVQDILLIVSLLWFLLSPGNKQRGIEEIPRWLPEFKNMNLFNKLDMGFMTTMQHLLFANLPYMFLVVIIPVIFYVHQLRTGKKNIRVYAIFSFLTFMLWSFSSILFDVFNITKNVFLSKLFVFSKLGLFTADNVDSKKCVFSFCLYFIFLALLFFIYSFEMEKSQYLILSAAFLGACLSRIALGFSATNYVSATRTFSVMAVTLIIIMLFMLRRLTSLKYYNVINAMIVAAAGLNLIVFYLQVTNSGLRYFPLWISLLNG